jgi:hypothetical protein
MLTTYLKTALTLEHYRSTPVAINDAVSSTFCEGPAAFRNGLTVRDYPSRNSIR